jgi:type IV pilus assembly protein PilQ
MKKKWCIFLLCCSIPCFSYQQAGPKNRTTNPPTHHTTPSVSFIYHLKYAPTISTKHLMQKLFKNDSSIAIYSDTRTRQIFMTGASNKIQLAKKWLSYLDIPNQQIIVNAQIINVDQQYMHNLGISISRNSTPTANAIVIPIASLHQQNILNLRIHTLEEQGHAKLLANPMLFTLNQSTANIETGTEIPYQEKTKRGGTSIAFKNATLGLRITPTILSKGQLLLKINVHHDIPSKLFIKGEPAIKTQKLDTNVILSNNHTVILGGIINERYITDIHAIPFLHNLPIFGKLFQNKTTSIKKSELLLIITPHLVQKKE